MKIILIDAWNTLFTTEWIYQKLYQLLETYANAKIVVTNANDEQLVQFGINKSPYDVFTLKHNPDKVDPIYFTTLFEIYALSSNDVLYIEHNLDAIKSAQSLGIKTFYYDKDKKTWLQ
jgi:FMN phosphatase YigB (HAD superfamily)